MRYLGFIFGALLVVIIGLINLQTNLKTLDIKKIKDYVVEQNIIIENLENKEDTVLGKKDEYILRLLKIKEGIENSKTSCRFNEYKDYKLKSIELLIHTISDDKNKEFYLGDVYKYNKLSNDELNRIINALY